MVAFFPRQTIAWHVEEPPAIRRLLLGIITTAATTGVLVRLWRWVMLSPGARPNDWLLFAAYAGETVILLGLATAHLGNFPVRHWLWRAPLFGVIAGVAEAIVSGALISAGLERLGSGVAQAGDWPRIAFGSILVDVLSVCIFALILAGVVQAVRYAMLRHEDRAHTARAIHQEQVKR